MTLDERLTMLASLRANLATLKADVPDVNHEYALRRAIDEADGALSRLRDLYLDRER